MLGRSTRHISACTHLWRVLCINLALFSKTQLAQPALSHITSSSLEPARGLRTWRVRAALWRGRSCARCCIAVAATLFPHMALAACLQRISRAGAHRTQAYERCGTGRARSIIWQHLGRRFPISSRKSMGWRTSRYLPLLNGLFAVAAFHYLRSRTFCALRHPRAHSQLLLRARLRLNHYRLCCHRRAHTTCAPVPAASVSTCRWYRDAPPAASRGRVLW